MYEHLILDSELSTCEYHIFRILTETGEYPGDGNPQSISFPNPDESSFGIAN